MTLFERDPRAETEEYLTAIKPEPERPKQLNVAELILALQHEDQELLVNVEGCDCHGSCDGVKVSEGKLFITRPDGIGIE